MPADPISPIAPARVRAILLPVGRIKKPRFESFAERLRPEYIVRLGDISQDVRPDRATFSPLAFPDGRILYDFTTSNPPTPHVASSPFETFREPLLVVGIVDGPEYILSNSKKIENGSPTLSMSIDDTGNLQDSIDQLRKQYPKALVVQLLAFDLADLEEVAHLPKEATRVPTPDRSRTTTIKTIMCDMSAKLLAEMALFARSPPELPSPESLSVSVTNRPDSTLLSSRPSAELMRTGPFHDQDVRLNSSATDGAAGREVMADLVWDDLSPATGDVMQDNSRPSSLANDQGTPPAVTVNDDSDLNALPSEYVETGIQSTKKAASSRNPSRDRLTTGTATSTSVSVTERGKNNLIARQAILYGSLYLQAGRWPDALRELVDGTTRARAFNDHVGHAKGLEYILVALVMLAWVNVDFQIPKICYSVGEKSISNKRTSMGNGIGKSDSSRRTAGSETRPVNELSSLLPSLTHMILSIHDRAAHFQGEVLSRFPYSQCVIRLSNLLSVLHHCGGQLNYDALQWIVRGVQPLSFTSRVTRLITAAPSKQEIATVLFRSLPVKPATPELSLPERVIIFSGIAAVLSLLDLQRKRVLVIKEMLSSLIPGLIQARKIGAAEVGIHPAAGLSALYESNTYTSLHSSHVEANKNHFQGLLSWLCDIFGAHNGALAQPDMIGPGPTKSIEILDNQSDTALLDRISKEYELRYFGGLNLKTDILRICGNFSEALPDFNSVMQCTAALLNIAGPGAILKPDFLDNPVHLAREEQIRLATKMRRTLKIMPKKGPSKIETAYWDNFLVRDISLSPVLNLHKLTMQSRVELGSVVRFVAGSHHEVGDPLVRNQNGKVETETLAENVVVAGERTEFVVSLQNLYDFDVVLENIVLTTKGVAFASQPLSTVLRPYRTQQVVLAGTPMAAGNLFITGCRVKIEGCYLQDFLVFRTPWKPIGELKIKCSGLACAPLRQGPLSRNKKISLEPHSIAQDSIPRPTTLSFKVCNSQPHAIITSNTLSQAIMTILVGETKSFSIQFQNTSNSVPIDFVHLSFAESTSSAVPYTTPRLDSSELHELEYQTTYLHPFRWRQMDGSEPLLIQPGGTARFNVDIIGRSGMVGGLIHINYAHIGIFAGNFEDNFLTRQVSLPLTITANPSILLQCFDVLHLGATAWSREARLAMNTNCEDDEPEQLQADTQSAQPVPHSLASLEGCETQDLFRKNSFLLLLDLRNVCPRPLAISVRVGGDLVSEANKEIRNPVHSTNEIIQPGHVARVVVPMSQLFVEDPYRAIPLMNPANKRQFIVGGDHGSSHKENEVKAAFWFRQEFLKHIDGWWEEVGSGKKGMIDLRAVKLSPRMIDIMRRDDVEIDMDLLGASENETVVIKTGPGVFEAKANELLILQARLQNHTQHRVRPLLQFQPRFCKNQSCSAMELTRRIAWTGLLKRPGPTLEPGQTCEISLALSILSAGHYEFGASVEAMRLSPILDDIRDSSYSSATPEAGRSAHLGNSLCTLIVKE